GGAGGDPLLPRADGLLPSARNRPTAHRAGGTLRLPTGRGTAARYISAPSPTGRQATQGANHLGRALLFAPAVLSVVPDLPALRLQGVSHRGPALLWRLPSTRYDRQHSRGGAARHRMRDGPRTRDGRFCRA